MRLATRPQKFFVWLCGCELETGNSGYLTVRLVHVATLCHSMQLDAPFSRIGLSLCMVHAPPPGCLSEFNPESEDLSRNFSRVPKTPQVVDEARRRNIFSEWGHVGNYGLGSRSRSKAVLLWGQCLQCLQHVLLVDGKRWTPALQRYTSLKLLIIPMGIVPGALQTAAAGCRPLQSFASVVDAVDEVVGDP